MNTFIPKNLKHEVKKGNTQQVESLGYKSNSFFTRESKYHKAVPNLLKIR